MVTQRRNRFGRLATRFAGSGATATVALRRCTNPLMHRCLSLLAPLALLGCAPTNDAGESTSTGDGGEVATSPAGPSDDGPSNPTTGSGPSTSAAEVETTAGGAGDGATDDAETSAAEAAETTTTTPTDSTGGEGGGSVECDELMACCDQLGADIYVGCATVVDLDMPGLCDSTLATYHQEGYCTGEPYCDDLGACCGELPPGPGWEETCTYYADLGNQPQCAMLISDYQLSGYCM